MKGASINDGDEESNEAVVLDLNQIQSEPTQYVTM